MWQKNILDPSTQRRTGTDFVDSGQSSDGDGLKFQPSSKVCAWSLVTPHYGPSQV